MSKPQQAGDAAGFYHDPPLWVDGPPSDLINPSQADFDRFREQVFRIETPTGVEVKVTREGLFAFSFSGWRPGVLPSATLYGAPWPFGDQVDAVLNRTLIMNSFLAFLYTNMLIMDSYELDRMVVTPELVIPIGGGLDSDSMGFGNQRVAHLALSSYPMTYALGLPPYADSRLIMRTVTISVAVLEAAVADLAALMSAPHQDGLLLLDLFLRASKVYQEHNYSASLIGSFAICERLLHELWQRRGTNSQPGKPPKQFSTVADVTKALLGAKIIDSALAGKVDSVRVARNGWVHSFAAVSAANAQESTSVCEQLIEIVRGVTVRGANALRIHG